MSLSDKTPAEIFKDLVKLDNTGNGVKVDGNVSQITDGNGINTAIKLSDRHLNIAPTTNTTTTFNVKNASGTDKFAVDTTNNTVKALNTHVNTMYQDFGAFDLGTITQNYYYPLPTGIVMSANDLYEPNNSVMGTSPATTLDVSSVTSQGAENLTACIWYLYDNITIDSAKVFATSGGHDLGCKIFSYDIVTSSSATGGDLSNGTQICTGNVPSSNNAMTIANLTISSANVTAGKVILAMLRNETGTNRFTAKIRIKYHLS